MNIKYFLCTILCLNLSSTGFSQRFGDPVAYDLILMDPDPEFTPTPMKQDQFAKYMNRLKVQNRANQQKYDVLSGFTEAAHFGTKVGVGVATMFAPGLGPVLAGAAADVAFSKITDQIDSYERETARNIAVNMYDKYLEHADHSKSDFEGKKPSEILDMLMDNPVFSHDFSDMTEDQQEYFDGLIMREASFSNLEALRATNEYVEKTESEMKAEMLELKNSSKISIEFAHKSQEELEGISKSLDDVNSGLGNILEMNERSHKDIQEQQKVLDFVESTMFGTLTPEEQIIALEKGALGRQFSELEREQMKTAAEARVLSDKISNFKNGAGALSNIVVNLGLEDTKVGKIVSKGAQAAVAAESVFNLGTSIYTGNVLGALGAAQTLSGFFGKSRQDPGAARHQQIMSTLSTIMTNQEIINEKLDYLITGQELIVENQRLIFDELVKIGDELKKQHQELIQRLDRIDYNLHRILYAMYETLDEGFKQCRTLADSIRNDSLAPDGLFLNYYDFYTFYDGHKLLFEDCRDTLRRKLGTVDDTIPFAFQLTKGMVLGSEDGASIDRFVGDVFEPTAKAYKVHLGDDVYNSPMVYVPTSRISQLDEKVAAVGGQRLAPKHLKGFAWYLLNYPVSSTAIQRFFGALPQIAQMINMAHGDGVYSPNDSRTRKSPPMLAYLEKALAITDLAIAQSQMVAGDVLIPKLYQILRADDTPAKLNVMNLLKKNQFLRANLINYIIFKSLEAGKMNSLVYHVARESQTLLDKVISFPGLSSDVNLGEFTLAVGKHEISFDFPDSEAIQNGSIQVPEGFDQLLGLRQQLVSKISEYVYQGELSRQMIKYANHLGQHKFLEADFNGDDLSELVKATGKEWLIFDRGPSSHQWEHLTDSSSPLDQAVAIDADGDGLRNDIVYMEKNSLSIFLSNLHRHDHVSDLSIDFRYLEFRDMDADGADDIVFPDSKKYYSPKKSVFISL